MIGSVNNPLYCRTERRSPSSSPIKRCFGAVSDRSADLGREDPVCGHLLTVKSFAPEDVAPVKKYLVQQLNQAFRRSEITENDKLTVASRTLNLFRHLQENAITSAKAYIHTDDILKGEVIKCGADDRGIRMCFAPK